MNLVSSLAMERSQDKLYDFIVVEEKDHYFGVVTIKDLLEKSYEIELFKAKHQNPLTGLPGNLLIEQRLHELVKKEKEFFAYYLDIDHFKAFNEVYGFEKGDLVISLLAKILVEEVLPSQFIGHIGGDDFVVLFENIREKECIPRIQERFEKEVLSYYSENHRRQGFLTAENRRGHMEKFPLITLTAVGIESSAFSPMTVLEVSESLAFLKSQEKRRFSNGKEPSRYRALLDSLGLLILLLSSAESEGSPPPPPFPGTCRFQLR
jgi:diguanylate cyclase (GGDEF)-like protein